MQLRRGPVRDRAQPNRRRELPAEHVALRQHLDVACNRQRRSAITDTDRKPITDRIAYGLGYYIAFSVTLFVGYFFALALAIVTIAYANGISVF